MSEPIRTMVEGAVGTIILSAPDTGNAIDQAFCDALLEAVHQMEGDDAVRCVLLQGSGRFFCVGGNIGAFSEAAHDLGSFTRNLTASLHMAIARLAAMTKPVVIAVNGPAAGAGLGLALVGDMVFAADSARFSVAYPAIGLSPDAGVSYFLPRLVGLRKAQEMLFLGKSLDAQEAVTAGLVSAAFADDALIDHAKATASKLSQMPTRALARSKRLFLESSSTQLEVQLERESQAIARCATEPHADEGVAAFLGRRPAIFP